MLYEVITRNDSWGTMGFFSGLNDEKYDRQYTDRELVRRIIGYFKPSYNFV